MPGPAPSSAPSRGHLACRASVSGRSASPPAPRARPGARPPPTPTPTPAARSLTHPLPIPPPPPRPALTNPVRISAAGRRTLPLPSTHADALGAYMLLPADNYANVDPALIRPCPGGPPGSFTLAVPRASILGVWVQPAVDVAVSTPVPGGPCRVVITSTAARLAGSPGVEALRLGERFSLAFTAVLTWRGGGECGDDDDDDDDSDATEAPAIEAATRVTVWAEPLGPFGLLPRAALSSAGDALLAGLTAALLPAFLGRLGDDFHAWAASPAVRAARAARASAAAATAEARVRVG